MTLDQYRVIYVLHKIAWLLSVAVIGVGAVLLSPLALLGIGLYVVDGLVGLRVNRIPLMPPHRSRYGGVE